jgi:succinate dehydrogenase / fumarate reductase flavoprotein subunit
MIRTLQDHGVHQGMAVYMECTIIELLKDGERISGAFGYYRERGRFVLFKAKAVVLATGGIGKAYKITSNSWEYTGDGQSLAYRAGAELIDMEFIQFHPTGMVWPPSVRGILVTEGVRGEGGCLRNNKNDRFLFGDIPDNYKPQTADNEEEGFLYVIGEKFQGKDARRPPDLLTRDHVARCIVREVKQGRGSPHGGVFLELETFAQWMKKRLPSFDAAEHWKKKLPSMYHQFKELGNVDITRQAMEVGPTTHYVMGGVRVDADTQMSQKIPGLFACGECAAGINGANRLGGNSLSDLLVLGKRAGQFAAKYSNEHAAGQVNADQLQHAERWALAFMDAPQGSENPYKVQADLQDMMQDLVGIVRREDEMVRALDGLGKLYERAKKVRVDGNREYNPGWHTALDLHNLLTVSEAITRAAILRKESRGGQFRDDYPRKDTANFGKVNTVVWKDGDGRMQIRLDRIPEMPAELKDVIREQNENKLPEELA